MRRRLLQLRGPVVVSAATGLLVAVIAVRAGATYPGTNGRIAFVSIPFASASTTQGVGDRDIFTVNPDGSGIVDVTMSGPEPRFAREPDWSPDGSKLTFRIGSADASEIYTANADGSGLTRLTTNTYKDFSPVWSPDGSTIAFASAANEPGCVSLFATCNLDIFVMPSTGGSATQITFDPHNDSFPQFSPDGTSLAYVSNATGVFAIYTVNLSTLVTTKLTADSLQAGPMDYSPDGTKIVFPNNFYFCNTSTSDCKSDIFVMNANGSSVTQLTKRFHVNYDPKWSPQGDKIAFTHAPGAQFYPSGVYTMHADGSHISRVTPVTMDSSQPDWGPAV